MRKKKPRLPPAPTGYELFDLRWASLTPAVEELLALGDADAAWTTLESAMRYAATVMRRDELAAELKFAPGGRVIARARQRKVALLDRSLQVQAQFICASLLQQACVDFPDANFGQAWVIVRDRVRALLSRATNAVLDLTEFERAELVAASGLA